jgi:peptidoglycan/LPS O-acetylase OafA/YrhL
MIIPPRISLKNPMGLFLLPSPGHLWFLQHLFIISLVILPLLRYLKSESGQRLIDRLAGWGERRGGMFLFLIPLVLVRIALRGIFPGMSTWADLVFYAVLFLIGYLIAADRRFTESYKRLGWVCLALGLVAFMAELIFIGPLGYPYFGGAETYSWSYVVFQIVMSVGSFCWVLFILSLGAKYLNFNKKALGYAGEVAYPFYTLHMPIVLVVGWFVVRWDLGILPKYLITVVVSFALIMALYELIVRRFDVTRFLFGMRPKKKL